MKTKTSNKEIKLGFISDLHTFHEKWNDSLNYNQFGFDVEQKWNELDILVFAGDCTGRGSIKDTENFMHWFNSQPAKHKVMIAGNHDFLFDVDKDHIEYMLTKYSNITYLNDSGVDIMGLKFWGSPVSPRFGQWAFNRTRNTVIKFDGSTEFQGDVVDGIKFHWNKIPNDTDILITHTPPLGQGDKLCEMFRRPNEYPRVGCADLKEAIKQIKPQINVFGHIHEGYGKTYNDGTYYINASCLNEIYRPVNAPIFHTLEIDK